MPVTAPKHPFLRLATASNRNAHRLAIARQRGLRWLAKAGLTVLGLTGALSAGASEQAWASRKIPAAIHDILSEDKPVQGLFAPRLRAETGTLATVLVEPLDDPDMEALDDLLPAPLYARRLLPETLLQQPPPELGTVKAPRSERAGVPEPPAPKSGQITFNTPVERIDPLPPEKRYSPPRPPGYTLPSQLVRTDILGTDSLPASLWIEAARHYRLPPEALYAIALQESGLRTAGGQMQPWPWTLNCNSPCPHGGMRYASREAATQALERLLKAGWRNIDIGAMQINYRSHAKRFGHYDLLDPKVNVSIGAVILSESVQKAGGSLNGGFARYHVGSVLPENAGRAQTYAGGVSRWVSQIRRQGGLQVVAQ